MKIKKHGLQRFVAMLLVIIMLFGAISTTALAAEPTEEILDVEVIAPSEQEPIDYPTEYYEYYKDYTEQDDPIEYDEGYFYAEEQDYDDKSMEYENIEDIFSSYQAIVAHQTVNVTLAIHGRIFIPSAWTYPDSTWRAQVFTMTVNGQTRLVYCLEPLIPAPPAGGYAASVLAQNSEIARALYYMWGSPGASQLFTPERRASLPNATPVNVPGIGPVGIEYTLSHLILGYLYYGRNFEYRSFRVLNQAGRNLVLQWVAWLDALPTPPHANKSFSNANVTATLNIEQNRQETSWITFNADPRNSITMNAASFGTGVTIELEQGGTRTIHSGSVTIQGGDRFRLFAPIDTPAGTHNSGNLYGSNDMLWRALIFNQGAETQTFGGFDPAVDPVDPIRLSVTWQEALGSLRIIKTVEHWDTRAGFEFEVHRVSDNHLVGRFTSPASGEIYIPNLVAGDYTIREIVPHGFIAPTPNPRTVAVVAGRTGAVATNTTFNNIRQRGVISVQKENTNPIMGDWCLSGARFRVRDASGAHVATIVTDENGFGRSGYLPLGTYTVYEYQAPWGYVLNPTVFTRTIAGDNSNQPIVYITPIIVPQDPQVGRIIVTKLDSETGERSQGDATLNGAIFHIYDINGTRVDILDTGNANTATSRKLPLGSYYVVEQDPPHGYTLNSTRHRVVIDYAGQLVDVTDVGVNVYNEVIQGRISLIKFTDATSGNPQIRPPLENAIFEIFLRSAGSFENALPTERDRITTDSNGFAQTKWLPYGWYVVREVYAPGDVRLVDEFLVYINSDGQTHFFILENPEFQSLVRIVKLDATTGQRIPTAGVAFRVFCLTSNDWVSQTFNYPTPTTIDVFHTNEEGWLVMPEPLRSGHYQLHEIRAPYGYLLSEEPVPFRIHSNLATDDNIVEVVMENMPVMGIISIEKICEETGNRLEGAVFNVIAAEDIITPDGTIRVRAGEIVDTITTDEYTESIPLFLGKYYLVEVEAPHGWALDPTPILVTLVYENQYVAIVTEFVTIENTPIRGRITIEKVCSETGERLAGAVFHIYDENSERVDVITTDKYGIAVSRDLPLGDYTVIEMYAPEGFIIDGASHDVTLSWESQYVAIVHEFITVENQPIRGSIRIIKVCAETDNRLAGAVFGLYQNGVRIAEATTCENGYAYFHEIPFGEFEIRELYAPEGFVLSDEVFVVKITEHDETVEVTIENERIPEVPEEPDVPKTGDDTQIPWVRLALSILGIIAVGVGLVMLHGKKKME